MLCEGEMNIEIHDKYAHVTWPDVSLEVRDNGVGELDRLFDSAQYMAFKGCRLDGFPRNVFVKTFRFQKFSDLFLVTHLSMGCVDWMRWCQGAKIKK